MSKLFTLGRVALNVLALTPTNVGRLQEITDNKVLVAVLAKDFVDDGDLVDFAAVLQGQGALISLGLGGGDPTQAQRVSLIAPQCQPDHVNQVFPLAAYTQGLLAGGGHTSLVNALVAPGPDDDTVVISTGARTGKLKPVAISCAQAAEMITEMKIQSVKFFPLNDRLANMANLAACCAKAGIPIFEPTGGIDANNVGPIVEQCLAAGVEIVIPHIYSSLVKAGFTDYSQLEKIWQTLRRY